MLTKDKRKLSQGPGNQNSRESSVPMLLKKLNHNVRMEVVFTYFLPSIVHKPWCSEEWCSEESGTGHSDTISRDRDARCWDVDFSQHTLVS